MRLAFPARGGSSGAEALTTATRVPGEFLEEPLGQIKPGMYADLTFLGGDPLSDIAQAANVRQVMVNGELHTVDELLAPFAAPAHTEAAPGGRLLPKLPDHPANAKYWWHDPHYLTGEQALLLRGNLTAP